MTASAILTKLDAKGVVTTCEQCGQLNRLPYASLNKLTRCGKCKNNIPLVSTPLAPADADQFESLAVQSSLPLLVDFWAPWCGPCRTLAPELEILAARNSGQFLVVKVNTEAIPALAQAFKVASIPTLVIMERGQEIARTTGARPAAQIEQYVRQKLGVRV